jgi:hypothetical protein
MRSLPPVPKISSIRFGAVTAIDPDYGLRGGKMCQLGSVGWDQPGTRKRVPRLVPPYSFHL